jgi:uncharacterized RDD family membrane protein YckC
LEYLFLYQSNTVEMEHKKFTVTDDLLASHSQRFLNLIIDLVIMYVIWVCIGETILIIADITKSYVLDNWVVSMGNVEKGISFAVIMLLYYGIMDMYFSRSLAKYFTKTIAVMKDGSKPDKITAIKRTLCRLIPFEPFSFFGPVPRGWHDTISQTYVVKKVEFEKKKHVVIFP